MTLTAGNKLERFQPGTYIPIIKYVHIFSCFYKLLLVFTQKSNNNYALLIVIMLHYFEYMLLTGQFSTVHTNTIECGYLDIGRYFKNLTKYILFFVNEYIYIYILYIDDKCSLFFS